QLATTLNVSASSIVIARRFHVMSDALLGSPQTLKPSHLCSLTAAPWALDLQQTVDVRLERGMLAERVDERAQLPAAIRVLLFRKSVVDPAEVPPRLNDPSAAQNAQLP